MSNPMLAFAEGSAAAKRLKNTDVTEMSRTFCVHSRILCVWAKIRPFASRVAT